MIARTKKAIREAYIANFRSFWWTVAGALTVAAIALMVSNQVTIGETAEDAERASLASERAVHRIQRERKQRIRSQEAINVAICEGNDRQDALLAGLIDAALQNPEGAFLGRERFAAALFELRARPDCVDIVKELTPASP